MSHGKNPRLGLQMELFFLLLLFEAGIRCLPFGWIRRAQLWILSGPAKKSRPWEWPAGLAAATDRLGARWGARCLARAMALQTLLGRRGVASRLRIGIPETSPGGQAHAWLELDGAVLLGGEQARGLYRNVPLTLLQ